MKLFSDLIKEIDSTTKIIPKVNALVRYFENADDIGKLWAIALLSGKRPKRNITTTLMREWAAEQSELPLWLFEDSYHVVGDLAETIALLLPEPTATSGQTLDYWIRSLVDLKDKEEIEKKEFILSAWDQLDRYQRFVFNKLLTGGMRIGVSQKLMTRALAKYTKLDENTIAYKLMGNWDPLETTFESLILAEDASADLSKPYPFYLAYAIEGAPAQLGNIEEWQIERKWDGIRGQVIIRNRELHIWSRGEELVSDKYPELRALIDAVPDGSVIDCEIICHDGEHPLPFNILQTRIGRKKVSKKLLLDAPVSIIAYDLLEYQGKDIRNSSMESRRQLLEKIHDQANHDRFLISEVLTPESWEAATGIRLESRKYYSEGLMLKRKSSEYKVGRKRGDWWKWKVDPLTIDAVMIYAMRGHGRRANLYTDYTFAVWDGDLLVPFTKAYSGLTDAEFRRVDAFVKKNTIERFGPVRSVNAELVFEIAFEGIQLSKRHKSGIALRFPRMLRWREDKPASEANTLDDLRKLLEVYG